MMQAQEQPRWRGAIPVFCLALAGACLLPVATVVPYYFQFFRLMDMTDAGTSPTRPSRYIGVIMLLVAAAICGLSVISFRKGKNPRELAIASLVLGIVTMVEVIVLFATFYTSLGPL